MRIPRLARAVLAVVVAVGLASACGGQGASSGSAAADDLTVGVSYPTANSPFFQAYTDFIQQGGRQLGVAINAVASDENEQKQLSDVQNLISQGVDGLVIIPVSTSVGPSLLRAAAQADVPVVVADRYPGYDPGTPGMPPYVAFIGPNDQKTGADIAGALAAAGGDRFLAIGGTPGSSVSEGRKAGLEQGAAAAGGSVVQYQVGGDSEEKGLQVGENLLSANPPGTANAFWCYNDNLCIGAIRAAQQAGRSDQFVFGGMDLTPQAIAAIQDGSYTVSYGGHWLEGGFGLAMLYDKLKGIDPTQPLVRMELLKVDKSNVAEFKAKFIDQPPAYDFTQLTKAHNPNASPEAFNVTLSAPGA